MSTPPVAVTCLSHLGMTVADLDASVSFYERVLGFVRLYSDEQEEWTRVGMASGDMVVELFSRRLAPPSGDVVDPMYPMEFGRPKIALTVVDVEATYTRLVAAGITPLCPVATTRVSRFFFIADPDGTPIQLHEFSGSRQRLAELFTPAR
ncbi:VOC family protein [Frankia sp. CNm7]|uniref:VOC family protein n=1 Tax=Frankia nepalensis TaxID=1836974 RepID=A0A937RMK3_9ACTN|nr:VOC family protein [Frankia nepalensis]MBL7502708.1 VOC family protein [Frankia nepalensis]MBL7516297.1 VOC family protein [Frankia nepalensis]MBL7519603.1 VOC family protein [Frankia nepalensis]MBL7629153.1 VOC family protein [Frankia nepalensis]